MVTILRDKFKILYNNRFVRSMKFRIMVAAFLLGVIPLLLFGKFVSKTVEQNIIDQRLEKIKNQATILRNHIMADGESTSQLSDEIVIEAEALASLYSSRLQIVDKNFKIQMDTYLVDRGKYNISQGVLNCFRGKNAFDYNSETSVVEGNVAILSKDSSEVVGVINLAFSTEEIDDIMQKIREKILLAEILAMVVMVGAAVYVSIHMVKPFKKIEESIDKISEGDLKERVFVRGYYETEQITDAFNHLLDRFSAIDESRTEFVSNVSHELKTPITSVKVLADSLLAQNNIPEEMYKEFLQDIVQEVDRENDIVTDLLTLVRLDKQADALKVEPVNVNEAIEVVIKRLRPIAAKRNIELVFESFRPVVAELDAVKIGIVINNLVENAIKYNILDGWVHVTLNADYKYFYLKVEDSGLGIPEDAQDKIFERFYRVDKSRSRDGDGPGGTGLGLAITKSIVLMHRGAIRVYSKEGEGTTFTVRIPLSYIRADVTPVAK